jgi:catechol 2,3-dioxygenase-like lactoylglutathione lyase family enzyme
MIKFDHIGLPSHDPRASATALAELLGAGAPAADGEDNDMFRVDLDDGAFLLFSAAREVSPGHVAFHLDPARFAAVVDRLRARSQPFGNRPDDPRNGLTVDELGGGGRVYFVDDDGHLFEITC